MAAVWAGPLGHLFDRFGAKRVIVPSVILLGSVFASLSVLTPHLWHLYAVFAIVGVAGMGTSPMAYARVLAGWFDRRRGVALAIAISGGSLGGVVHPPSAEALIRVVGWRGATLIFGGLLVAVGLPIILRFVRERPYVELEPLGDGMGHSGASVREGMKSRVFWILIIVLFSSSIAHNATLVHLSALLTDRGVPADRAAMALSAMAGGSVVGRLLTGWLVDRYFAPFVSLVLLALAALGTFMLSGAHSFATGALAAMLIGFGMGGESDVIPYLLSRYFGLRSFSTLYGLTWTAAALAGVVGPILMGRAFDATGSYEAMLVRLAALTLLVATSMLALPGYARLPATASR
jgi:MFS family permease